MNSTENHAIGKGLAVAFVDAAIKAGKPISAVRDIYIAQYIADPETTQKLINAMVSITPGGGQQTGKDDLHALS